MILSLLLIFVCLLSVLFASYYSTGAEIAGWRLLINLFAPMAIGVSCVIFIALNLIGLPLLIILLLELITITVLLYKLKKANHIWQIEKKSLTLSSLLSMPGLLIVVVYVYSWVVDAGVFLFDSVRSPHGLWDAWNYWNLKAKIISKAPDIWPQLFHQMVSEDFHVDYPLLQTGFIAQCWLSLKNDTVWVPILLSFVFTFSTIGLLSSSVSMLTHRIKGLIAGLIMLCTPFYMVMGDSQYADNVVGFFFLATIVLLTLARKQTSNNNPALFIMAGVAAGLSAWSKNEGLLFLLCLFCVQFSLLLFKDFKSLLWELKYIALGVLPTLILIIYFKYAIAPPNDIIKAQGQSTLDKLSDPARYSMVIEWFSKVINSFGNWYITPWWFFWGGLILYRIDWIRFRYLLPNLLLVLFMAVGFFFIYIITPLDLEFHLSTSLHRLFFQLFPSLIFTYFILINDNVNVFKNK